MRPRPPWPGLAAAAAAFTLYCLTPESGAAQATVQRAVVVISDLHMGAGRDEPGRWRRDEDFRWAGEFSEFLRTIDAQLRSTVDLVLNGDTFDLLPAEGPALASLDRVLAAHTAEIDALAAFARAGTNRVVLVPGDRDSALRFGKVAERVVRALRGPADRVTAAASGYWLSHDGKVHAEHGHEIRLRAQDLRALHDLYERLEPHYPIVDSVAVLGAGAKYALAADNALASADTAALLVRDGLLSVSWQQFRMELDDGEVQPPRWDVMQARRQGASLLVSSLADDDPLKPLAAKLDADGRLSSVAADLTDEELTALCDYRAAVRRARRRFEPLVTQFAPRGPAVTECPRTPDTRGAIFDYFWRSRDELYGDYVERATRRANGPRPPVVFAIGHTHLADRAQSNANMISGGLLKIPMEGFSPVRGALTPVVINGGAWNRTITPVQLERLHAERKVSWHDLLRSLEPEELPPCYAFVHVPAYDQDPAPAVRYWSRAADGAWSIAPACSTFR
jgi:UDP-2,3-diacylglucosamine pyrophosphatase LpxH